MPRPCGLGRCVRCRKNPAVVGAYTGYYVVRQHLRDGCQSPRMTQIKGAFRARGFCSDCFMVLAKEQGLDRDERAELARELQGGGRNRRIDAKVRP